MQQARCVNCNKVLFEFDVKAGRIRRKCGNCKTMNEVVIQPEQPGPGGTLVRLIEPDRIRINGSPEA